MFHLNREKIIAHAPRVNSPGLKRRIHVAALFVFLSVSLHSPSSAATVFDRSNFNQIEFSPACAHKQWAVDSDGGLVLSLTAPDGGFCEATLRFHFPQDIKNLAAVSFDVRALKAGPFMRVGVAEKAGVRGKYTRLFPDDGLRERWQEEGVRFQYIRQGFSPTQVAELHFVVVSNRSLQVQPAVMIRGIRFGGTVAPATVTSAAPAPVPVASDVAPAPSAQPTAPEVVHPVVVAPRIRVLLIRGGETLLGLVGFAMLLLFIWGGRGRRRRILSPLYEINLRMWRTHRDSNGVVQYGGFNKVTAGDLKAIKQSGFNALWFMGIWEIGPKVRVLSKNYGDDFQGSPFAIYDYSVSHDLGTDEEFRGLVQRAHTQRLSVIVDFVPNHMGLDSAWLNDHPEYFIHRVLDVSESDLSDDVLQERYPGYYPYRTPSYPEGGRRVPKTILVAYGKDPYFFPWIDTAQLDYAQPALRKKMIDVLCRMARVVDGVRCDMAMLLLREQVKAHRHPEMSWEAFNQMMPHEFWTEAIQAVKRVNPNFVFMAETYWSMEGYLQSLGFDYTYNKPLYEAICGAVNGGHAEGFMNFLRLLGTDFLKRSVHFLENHDEERAMNMLGEDRQKAAAAILCTLPGIALLHQGQMEGKRERLPVQRVISLHQEPEHHVLRHFYRRLLKATALPVFQEGRLVPLYSNNSALASYTRIDQDTKVLVVVNTSNRKQQGSVFLMPGLSLNSSTSYKLNDLFYEFKSTNEGSVQPFYEYTGAKLINNGLYIELEAYDAHIFVVEPQGVLQSTNRALQTVRQTLEEWPLNRVARRTLGAAFTRSSDLAVNPAANPAGRQS